MRVLIVDDHQLFIDGISHILKKLDPMMEIIESNLAEKALEFLETRSDFDLILLDLSMPGTDGISILKQIHKKMAWLPLVVVSAEEDSYKIKSALDAGAIGFIPKSHSSQQMLAALECILDGDIYLPDELQKKINHLQTRRPPAEANTNGQLKNSGITKRQYEVLQLLAKGYSNKQIANSLFLTEHTIKAHISALFDCLNAHNRTECVQTALQKGILVD